MPDGIWVVHIHPGLLSHIDNIDAPLRGQNTNSAGQAGVAIDAIRCAKLALDRGQGGILYAPSAYFCKHPPRQYTDDEAFHMMEYFILDKAISEQ